MTWDWALYFQALSQKLGKLHFGPPIDVIYNPLEYASLPLMQYCNRFGDSNKEILFLGMNPGPFGMVQTGIPFGEVQAVRNYLRIDAPVSRPVREHPRRPVEGFNCRRSEVSGKRLWNWIQLHHPRPETFFEHCFVANYCPLAFLGVSGKNITPEQLPHAGIELFSICDDALRQLVIYLGVRWVIGIGQFAARRARQALSGLPVQVEAILHPSPASPAANRNWAQTVTMQLEALRLKI